MAAGRSDAGKRKLEAERDEAYAQRDEAHARLAAVQTALAEASANVEAWLAELEDARTRAVEAELLLEAERSRHAEVHAEAA
jgi:chromosome segregation ATPase